MPNLEEKIAEWRRKMAAEGIRSPSVLDELESHLREDIECGMKAGFSDTKAFEAATRRMGQSSLLKAEFAKVGRFAEARPGKVIGIALCVLAAMFALWAMPFLVTVSEMTLGERLLGFAAVAVTLFAPISWRFSHRYLPPIRSRALRMTVGLVCSLAGVAWLYAFGAILLRLIVPRIFGSLSPASIGPHPFFIMAVSLLWALALAALLGSVAFGLEETARRQARKETYV